MRTLSLIVHKIKFIRSLVMREVCVCRSNSLTNVDFENTNKGVLNIFYYCDLVDTIVREKSFIFRCKIIRPSFKNRVIGICETEVAFNEGIVIFPMNRWDRFRIMVFAQSLPKGDQLPLLKAISK